MIDTYKTIGHAKFLLQVHLVFVCKYRRHLVASSNISSEIKKLSMEIVNRHNIIIRYMETDKDHIHYLLEYRPNTNIANFVKTLKSYTTFHIWEKYPAYLSKCFWKEKTFWSDGYFVASIGNVSDSIIKEYIENQGK